MRESEKQKRKLGEKETREEEEEEEKRNKGGRRGNKFKFIKL